MYRTHGLNNADDVVDRTSINFDGECYNQRPEIDGECFFTRGRENTHLIY